MNSATLRRLASDHSSLHASPLPPHYLFPSDSDVSSIQDDLTQLVILLAGPHGTPYSAGLWKLHLRLPEDYPRSPPKASFRTRIWHPNVEESTGSICVDTLKRDWDPKLTLRDVLVTISCLLIQPNPDSALNATAGQLLQDDYEAFARQAKIMTSIHAPVPKDLRAAVLEARGRGDEAGMEMKEDEAERKESGRRPAGGTVVMKKRPQSVVAPTGDWRALSAGNRSGEPRSDLLRPLNEMDEQESGDEDDEASASKENDPALSPSPVAICPPSPRKHVLGKRPLADLPTPIDPEAAYGPNESTKRNIVSFPTAVECAGNAPGTTASNGGPRKSPKLVMRSKGVNDSGRIRDDLLDGSVAVTCSATETLPHEPIPIFDEGKENGGVSLPANTKHEPSSMPAKPTVKSAKAGASRKVSGASSASSKSSRGAKPRIGLRRL